MQSTTDERLYSLTAGHRLRQWRTGLTVAHPLARVSDVAREVGVTPSYISQIENTRCRCSRDLRARIAEALGVKVAEIVRESASV
ncbi:helix-turn-helix transcriptional regulator [Parafrankia sp. FMc6]|uniref:helix-turn-helix domain-containing protein n=1 Tax=Parafrankia soli TaxID=2599596 RepID=UPI0034D58287